MQKSISILIVEDEVIIAHYLKEILEEVATQMFAGLETTQKPLKY